MLEFQSDSLYDEGDYQAAIIQFEQAIGLNAEYVEAWNCQGNAYRKLADCQQAIHTKAIQLEPTYMRAYLNRGVIYDGLGQYEAVREDFMKAIELEPSYARASYYLALALEEIDDCRAATRNYQKALALGQDLIIEEA